MGKKSGGREVGFHNILINRYFDKSTIGLHCFVVLSVLEYYQDDWRSITISS